MTKPGVIAISRKLFAQDDPFFGGEPFSRREAWAWMIASAAWKAGGTRVGNGRSSNWIALDRGQLAYGRAFLQNAWGWSSEKAVRCFLDALERDGRIKRQEGRPSGQRSCIITICKYDQYQFGGDVEAQEQGQPRANHLSKKGLPSVHPTGQPNDEENACETDGNAPVENIEANDGANQKGQPSSKKGPQYKEDKITNKSFLRSRAESPAGFREWYEIYPKKKQPVAAEKAYAKTIASGRITHAELLERTAAFAATWTKRPAADRQYIPYPASWLNAGGYADEPDGQTTSEAPAPRDPRTFTTERWERLVSHHDRTGEWSAHWGAPPGDDGCLVPHAVIAARSRSPPIITVSEREVNDHPR